MEIFDTSKSILENLSLASNPLLALLGVIAILQLRLAKKTLTISSQREAAQLATNQIDRYFEVIIPLHNNLDDAKEKEKIPSLKIEVGKFNTATILKKLGNKETLRVMNEREKIAVPFLNTINAMESFSTYFVKGVADEEIAFSAVGKTFCSSVEDMYFDIAVLIDDNADHYHFQNTITLYKIWSSRIKKAKLARHKEKITAEIEKLANEKVDPIGTK